MTTGMIIGMTVETIAQMIGEKVADTITGTIRIETEAEMITGTTRNM